MSGSPCQSVSVIGKNKGADKGSGTRSSLLWENIRIAKSIRPKVLIWENVKGILTKRHKKNYDLYKQELEEIGYKNYSLILNAADFGVPQQRIRVFTISILKDSDVIFNYKEPKRIPRVNINTILESKEEGMKIRKLTPLESWRLMGFTDEEFAAAEYVSTNS